MSGLGSLRFTGHSRLCVLSGDTDQQTSPHQSVNLSCPGETKPLECYAQRLLFFEPLVNLFFHFGNDLPFCVAHRSQCFVSILDFHR